MVNPFYQHQVLNNPKYTKTLGDYKPCKFCGYDTGKSKKYGDARCGSKVERDYTDRALKQPDKG